MPGNITAKTGVGNYSYTNGHAHKLAGKTGTSYRNCDYGYDQNGNVDFRGCRNYT